MKSLSGSLFMCACALVLVVEGFPNGNRLKRETTSEASSTTASDSSSSTTAEPVASESPNSTPSSQNNDFGFGAAAGIGGLRQSVGFGNFDAETKSDAFSPWGAFAGINLGGGGRIGAGCSGLNCGVQLGHFVLGTPHLLGIGKNLVNPNGNGPDGKKAHELTERAETNLNNAAAAGGPEDIRYIFRDAFRGFRETLQSFFRAPVTHFIKKHVHIDNSTESVVGNVKSAASEQHEQTYRIQLTPSRPATSEAEDKDAKQQENELE